MLGNSCYFLNKETLPRFALIGAKGQQAREYYNLMHQDWNFVAHIDTQFDHNDLRSNNFFNSLHKVSWQMIDIALVCIPHKHHADVTAYLIDKKVAIIKEKPLSTFACDLHLFANLQQAVFVLTQFYSAMWYVFRLLLTDIAIS